MDAARTALKADEELVSKVRVGAAIDVVAIARIDRVVAVARSDRVDLASGVQQRGRIVDVIIRLVPRRRDVAAVDRVIAPAALDRIRTGAACERIVSVAARDRVVTAEAAKVIVPAPPTSVSSVADMN